MKTEQDDNKSVVWVKYEEKGKAPVVLKCYADPFEILEWVEKRIRG